MGASKKNAGEHSSAVLCVFFGKKKFNRRGRRVFNRRGPQSLSEEFKSRGPQSFTQRAAEVFF